MLGGWGISTDLDTITVLSSLLPHHFWPRSHCAAGNRKALLSSRRFGQSGIKCRALFSHSVPGVGSLGEAGSCIVHFHTLLSEGPQESLPPKGK